MGMTNEKNRVLGAGGRDLDSWIPGLLTACVVCLADVAIGAPFGGETQQGVVFVFPGVPKGLGSKPSQVLLPLWAAGHSPDFFGSALRGGRDLDGNGYPGELRPRPLSPLEVPGHRPLLPLVHLS